MIITVDQPYISQHVRVARNFPERAAGGVASSIFRTNLNGIPA